MPVNSMVSYKYDLLGGSHTGKKRGTVREASLILFHGRPRPHEVREPWNVPWAARTAGAA